jgi:hypothetical protein
MYFNWSFPQFIVNPKDGDMTEVVIGINWICTATDGNVSANSFGTVMLPAPNPAEFIPYDQITYQMTYDWVGSQISMPIVEKDLTIQVENLSQPATQSQNPPF